MYDPLIDASPGEAQPLADSYWHHHSQPQWPKTSNLPDSADVVVIGSGYTGLNAAITLAEKYQQRVVVIEANHLSWGCSSRNAGFVMKSTGRLGLADWQTRYGTDTARQILTEHEYGLEKLQQRRSECPEQLQAQLGGYYKLAHRPQAVAALRQQYQTLRQFDPAVRFIEPEQINGVIHSQQAHAALHFSDCFALNPLLLAAATARKAASSGAQLVDNTRVIALDRSAEGYRVTTSRGTIQTGKVCIATNAYTPKSLCARLDNRSLPVLSSVIVTAPLTAEEIAATGLVPGNVMMDTRELKYYYRLLPDGRLLFGGRGAIQGKNADDPVFAQRLLHAMWQSFPMLRRITEWQYFWSGWVSVSLDDYPRIGAIDDNLYAAMGYCGAGVSFTSVAGERLADAAMAQRLPALPYYQSPLKRFPMARFRRLGQWLFYHYGRIKDGDWR